MRDRIRHIPRLHIVAACSISQINMQSSIGKFLSSSPPSEVSEPPKFQLGKGVRANKAMRYSHISGKSSEIGQSKQLGCSCSRSFTQRTTIWPLQFFLGAWKTALCMRRCLLICDPSEVASPWTSKNPLCVQVHAGSWAGSAFVPFHFRSSIHFSSRKAIVAGTLSILDFSLNASSLLHLNIRSALSGDILLISTTYSG